MPRATVDPTASDKYDLKTCPGGFVVLRRLSYGEKLQRRAMTANMTVKMQARRSSKKDVEGLMKLMSEAAQIFDFTHCIQDHNLEDENGTRLNLGSQDDVRKLDPRVGEEIENLLDSLNNFEEEEDEEGNPSSSGSTEQ